MAASEHVSMESQTWPRRDDRASSPGWRRALFVDAERPRATSAVGAVKKLEFLAAGGYGVPQVVSGVISIGACRLMPAGCAGGRRAMRQSRIGSNSTSQQRVARDREMMGEKSERPRSLLDHRHHPPPPKVPQPVVLAAVSTAAVASASWERVHAEAADEAAAHWASEMSVHERQGWMAHHAGYAMPCRGNHSPFARSPVCSSRRSSAFP